MRLGMRRLSSLALKVVSMLSVAFFVVLWAAGADAPLSLLMAYLLVVFFCIGMLFANLNALAMEPLGHIAGVGAAVVGSMSTFISLPLGVLIGQAYDGTVLPLVTGFALLAVAALAAMQWAR